MTNSLAEGVAFVIDHPNRQNVPGARYRIGYGWSWSQLCVALVYWALGATHSYGTANIARANSTIVSTSRKVPDGAIVWFALGSAGHVGFWAGGVMYSATRYASNLGSALGTMTLEQYERASGGRYLGYSFDLGGQTFAGVSTAGFGSVTPLSPPSTPTIPDIYQGKKMQIVYEALNAANNHYMAHLIAEDGTIVDSIDNQEGWTAGTPWVPNPIYVIYVQIFDPRQANINPILTVAQMAALNARIASHWVKPAGGSGTTNVTVDNTAVLAAITELAGALGADTTAIEAAIAAIKIPTGGTVTLS